MIPPLGKAAPVSARGDPQHAPPPLSSPTSPPLRLRFEERLSGTVDPQPAAEAATLLALLGAVTWPPLQHAAPLKPEALPVPLEITPHDLAATVRSLQRQEPGLHDGEVRWTVHIEDPLTPLSSLRISGDALQGWRLQLIAAPGSPPQLLARHTGRLATRLQSRGQPVRELLLGDDEEETLP